MKVHFAALTVELAELRQRSGTHPHLEVLVGDAVNGRDVVGVRLVEILHGGIVGVVVVVLGAGGGVLVVLAVVRQALRRTAVQSGGHHLTDRANERARKVHRGVELE